MLDFVISCVCVTVGCVESEFVGVLTDVGEKQTARKRDIDVVVAAELNVGRHGANVMVANENVSPMNACYSVAQADGEHILNDDCHVVNKWDTQTWWCLHGRSSSAWLSLISGDEAWPLLGISDCGVDPHVNHGAEGV